MQGPSASYPSARLGPWRLPARTAVMGVLNLTPDSFSDGGAYTHPDACRRRLLALVAAGADLIDVGAESTRPGAAPVPADEQLRRLQPVFQALSEVPVPCSIDTRDAVVAEACCRRGFEILNDVSAGGHDPALARVAAAAGAVVIAMHMRGTPATMDAETEYRDLMGDVTAEWQRAAGRFAAAGVPRSHLWFDPGIGFAKTAAQSWDLIRGVARFRGLGGAVVVGPSRKRFLGIDAPPAERDAATHAVVAFLAAAGVDVVRVHDVAGARQAVAVAAAYAGEAQP